MSIGLGVLTGTGIRPECRLCGQPSQLVVHHPHANYHYCARCTDAALERAELKPDAAAKRGSGDD